MAGTLWQAQRAERHYREVRQLTNSYLFEVHDAIRELPSSTEARRIIIGRALEYLARLSREASDDPQLRLDLAAAYLQIGDVQGKPYAPNLGDSAGALRSYDLAVQVSEPLAASERDSSSVARRVLSQAEENIGAVQSRLNRWEEAMHNQRRSLAIRKALLVQDPRHADDWNQGLTMNYLGFGDAVVSRNRLHPMAGYQRRALVQYRRALPLCERLYAAHPERASYAALVVKIYSRIATELSEIGAQEQDRTAFAESADFHHRALAISEKLLNADPTNASVKRRLADGLIAAAYLLAQSGNNLEEAVHHCQRSLELTANLASLDPANAEAWQDLSSAHFVADRVCQAQGDPGTAADHYRHSLTILERPVTEHPDNVETAFDLGRGRQSLRGIARSSEQ